MSRRCEAMTATQLQRLLKQRHTGDVYVPECKMGAAGSRSLDGWALLPTWSPLTTIGYEIKVSRSDWLQDQKFEFYRSVCHLFFVVAPKGVAALAELPQGVGLLEPIGKGTGMRLVMRSKPVRQEPDGDKLVRLMAHVLMWRRDISEAPDRPRRAEIWRRWVEERQEFRAIAMSVKGRMRTLLTEALDARSRAESNASRLQDTADVLKELGITAGYDRWSTKRAIERALTSHQTETLAAVRAAVKALQRVEDIVSTDGAADVAALTGGR